MSMLDRVLAAPRPSPRLRLRALLVAAVVLAVEVVIATRLGHWRWVRTSLGDFLVVFPIYFVGVAFRAWPPVRWGAAVFAFAALVELSQAAHLADALGLAPGSVAHTVLGATFSVGDLVMYAAGCVVCGALDLRWRRTDVGRTGF